jgi:hypothetical protein
VFAPRPDILLVHLSHPMMQRALSALTRRRYPGTGEEVSRWTVRRGDVPAGADGLLLLSVEELAVNDLRETFHHWVRTLAFPLRAGTLGDPAPWRPVAATPGVSAALSPTEIGAARDLIDDVMPDLKRFIETQSTSVTARLRTELDAAGAVARREEDERYRSRAGEVSALIAENTLLKLEREIAQLHRDKAQGTLFDEDSRIDEIERSIEMKQEEIQRRTRHYEEVRHLLPTRHRMSSDAQLFPVTIEVMLPRMAS